MSYGNRSKEYDWFKGGSNGNNKKSPKETMKTIWKFTRIFLMFSLFFFSMWGCVQVMVIKTDNNVGRGVEFYSSDSNVSPHVSRMNISKTTKNGDELYSIGFDDKNTWINDKDNATELAAIQKQMTNTVDNDPSNDIKLYDASKGRNEALNIRLNDKPASANGSVVYNENGKYLALSSISPTYSGLNLSSTALAFTVDTSTWVADPKWAPNSNELKNFNASKAKPLKFSFTDDMVNAASGKYAARREFAHSVFVAVNRITNGKMLAPTTYNEYLASNQMIRALGGYVAAGYKTHEPTNTVELVFAGGFLNGETNYLPIGTWAQAWTRGVGPFYGLFVYPISQLAIAITDAFPLMDGWESFFAMVLIVFTLRILAFGISFKSTLQQTKQQEIAAKKATIDAKYASYGDNKQMKQRKQQEIQALYKKEGISPLGALGSAFVTMPIFLSLWRVIGGTQHLKSTIWLGVSFSATSWKELFAGQWAYLPLMIFAAFFAAIQQIYPRLLTKRRNKDRINVHQKAAMKKNNKTQNIIMVVFVIMSLIFSAGLQVYWIIGGIWSIIQTTISHYIIIHMQKRRKRQKVRI